VVILFNGGADKDRQKRDIEQAKVYLQDLKKRGKNYG
jgi:putative component of toxin-antitoxin plasmid stabilization module